MVLERFMQEFFPFTELLEAAFFTKEMEGNYPAQAKRVCNYFGYETVYEYGSVEVTCHLSFDRERPVGEPFVLVTSNIYL